jgi:hypothetical protein
MAVSPDLRRKKAVFRMERPASILTYLEHRYKNISMLSVFLYHVLIQKCVRIHFIPSKTCSLMYINVFVIPLNFKSVLSVQNDSRNTCYIRPNRPILTTP